MATSLLRWAQAATLASLLALGVPGPPAAAAILTVTDCGDSGAGTQLRALLAGAAAGDTIVLPACTVTLQAGELVVGQPLTLIGSGVARTAISGGGASPVLRVNLGGVLTVVGIDLTNGKGLFGGAIGSSGILILIDAAVTGSTATASGGGINNGGALTLINSTVSGNTGLFAAGGILSGGTLTVVNSTLTDNHAPAGTGDGGAVYNLSGQLTVVNTTISGNTSGQGGGAIYTTNLGANVSILNSTIAGNTAAVRGGGIRQGSTAITHIKNSIVATNSAPEGSNCFGGGITSVGHNLEDGPSCGFTNLADLPASDPGLGPLGDHGGPTLTQALLPGSPAIDAGDNSGCPPTDQRGVTRPRDGDHDGTATCDVGAYELVASTNRRPGPSP